MQCVATVSRTTPFGFPVVPEVYKMYNGCVALRGTQGFFRAVNYSIIIHIIFLERNSRPNFLLNTITFFGLCAARAIASSTKGYVINLSTSIPDDAVMIRRGLQSSILMANSCKTAKTTEWITPILAQATLQRLPVES
jgi:hypothetical protein